MVFSHLSLWRDHHGRALFTTSLMIVFKLSPRMSWLSTGVILSVSYKSHQAKISMMKSQSRLSEEYFNDGQIERQADLLVSLIEDVTSLKKEAEQALSALMNLLEQEQHPVLNRVVENLIKELRPPPPPDVNKVREVGTILLSYRDTIRNYLSKVRKYVDIVRKLASGLRLLTDELNILKEWQLILENNYPKLFVRAQKIYTKASHLLEKDNILNVEEYVIEISEAISEIQDFLKTCKVRLERDIGSLLKKIEVCEKLYRQIRKLVGIEEIQKVNDKRMRLERIRETLEEARLKAPLVKVDLAKTEREIDGVLNSYRELFNSFMKDNDFRVYRGLSEWKTIHKESIPLHVVVDKLSRKLGMSYNDILEALYELCKRNVIIVKVKVSDA